jgi:hypothetical protein
MKLNKKAALALSVQAIVVIVIAFVVLGLALTLTRTVFKLGQSKVGEAIDVVDLDVQPSPDNTLTIEKIIISRNDQKELKIGFYNKLPEGIRDATLQVTTCQDSAGNEVDPPTDGAWAIPAISTIKQDVAASESAGYKALFSERGMTAGQYICEIGVMGKTGDETEDPGTKKDVKQFFLTVNP